MAGTLGGAGTFDSVLDCSSLWLHCVFAAAGLAGVHGCSLGITHWCTTNLELEQFVHVTCMVSMVHAYGVDLFWRH